MNKQQKAKMLTIVETLRAEGVPFWITYAEAYNLSGGEIGVPYSHKLRNKPMHLHDYAKKMSRLKKVS